MEGFTALAGYRLAEYERAGIIISCVEGVVRAWKPDPGDPCSGELHCGLTEAELLAKLDDALG